MKKKRHAPQPPAGFDPLDPVYIPSSAAAHIEAARALVPGYVAAGGNENAAPMAADGSEDEDARLALQGHVGGYIAAMEEAALPHPDAVELYRLFEGAFLDGAVFVQIDAGLPLRVRVATGTVIDAPTDVSRLVAINRTTGEQGLAQPEHTRLMDWPAQKRDPDAFRETMHDREPRLAFQAYDELCRQIAEDLAPGSVWAEQFAAARARYEAGLLQQEAEGASAEERVAALAGYDASSEYVSFDDSSSE